MLWSDCVFRIVFMLLNLHLSVKSSATTTQVFFQDYFVMSSIHLQSNWKQFSCLCWQIWSKEHGAPTTMFHVVKDAFRVMCSFVFALFFSHTTFCIRSDCCFWPDRLFPSTVAASLTCLMLTCLQSFFLVLNKAQISRAHD